jgi:hypothetical protein
MKGLITAVLAALGALAASTLLAGCAADTAQNAYADSSYNTVGTYIPRKKSELPDNVSRVDKQSLDNDRIMGNGTMNPPGK